MSDEQLAAETIAMMGFLRQRGWFTNDFNGWWHPPSCLASWPLREAYEMAKRDELAEHRRDVAGSASA